MLVDEERGKSREALLQIYQAAIYRVNGYRVVADALADFPDATVSLIAIGKAADAMAGAVVEKFAENVVDGLVITKTGHFFHQYPSQIHCFESDHPILGEASLQAGKMLLKYCQSLPDDRPVIVCLSGGASSLVEVPVEGVTLAHLQEETQSMLADGLSIDQINARRCQFSLIKGGKLVGQIKARPVDVFVVSDVKQDDLSVIGSGLLYSPDPNEGIKHHIVANLEMAKQAAAKTAKGLGYSVFVHDKFLEDEVSDVANQLMQTLKELPKGIHIWGGETVVNLPFSPGRGGRNQHLALLLADKLRGGEDITMLVAGTDGTDGATEDAGAIIDGATCINAEVAGIDVNATLSAFDSGSLLAATGDLIHTGPTGTNVMDLVIAIKE